MEKHIERSEDMFVVTEWIGENYLFVIYVKKKVTRSTIKREHHVHMHLYW